MITHLHVEGYRSIRSLRLDLGAANVVLGPNGSIARLTGTPAVHLEKVDGETRVGREDS